MAAEHDTAQANSLAGNDIRMLIRDPLRVDPEDEYDAENNYDDRNYDYDPPDDDGREQDDHEYEIDNSDYEDDRWTIIDRNDFF